MFARGARSVTGTVLVSWGGFETIVTFIKVMVGPLDRLLRAFRRPLMTILPVRARLSFPRAPTPAILVPTDATPETLHFEPNCKIYGVVDG